MILYVFVVVLFNGFVLMLSILSVMRGLYALGVCERPLSSTDHVRQISLHRFESQTDQTVRTTTEASLLPNRGFAQVEVRINRSGRGSRTFSARYSRRYSPDC
jgi:hypothetical protein